jgi:Carboxypeptidase regulatory-like domain/TonB dependent receptor-like, beta-barrel
VSELAQPAQKRVRWLSAGLIALAFCFGAESVQAQVLYGSIVGNVHDSQGASVPGAIVTIVSKETNLTRDTTTNEEGAYSLINVLAGTYDIKVALQGFRETVRESVPVTVGQISRIDVTMEVGTLTETITVNSAAQLLQTEKAEVSTELRSTEITAMPTNQFRNYQALINLVPGSVPMRFQNAETDTPARSLTTNVNGQAINNNATRTDGATNVNIWLPSHNMYVSPVESIDTVAISSNNFDAEQGMAGGSAITVVTKSGTNQFKGSAFEFYNSDKLNASPYFFGNAAAKPDKLPVKRNTFGGTLGGPIKQNRVFFFGSYEGYKSTQSLFTFHTVPDAALRNGDFSNARNTDGSLQVIFDPMTGNPDGTGRLPFANNRLPADRINAIARQIQNLYPAPNTAGSGAGSYTNNYQREETRTTDRHNYDVKVNWNRTSSHQIWGKFSYMDAVVDDLTNYLGPDPNASGDGGFTKVTLLTGGHTWTLSPTLILDSTFGFSRQDQDVLGPDFQAGNFGLDVLGIPGTNDQGTGDQRYAGYPRFGTGFAALGNRDGWNPIFRDERTYSFATNVTKLAGAHEFRGGYLVNFLYLDHWQPESGNPRGNFDFATNATALRGTGVQAGNFYNQYAAFLLGLVGTANKSTQNELMTGREWQHGLFIRDRWTVSPKLTLDLGVRWEYYPIMSRADRGIELLDLNMLEVILGGRGGNPNNLGLTAGKDNFAPRLGVVYRMNDDTVFRTGFGVTYNPIPWSRPVRGDLTYPITINSNFVATDSFGWARTINQGIPFITGPDQSSGRVPLPNSATMRVPEPGNIDRGTIKSWNVSVERRLPWNMAVDLGYVAAKGDGGYAAIDVNSPQTIGVGNAGRPYSQSFGRNIAVDIWGQRLVTSFHSLQIAVNRPFTNGLLLKGAYTFGKAFNNASAGNTDEDGRVAFWWNMDSQFDRNYSLAGYDRRHNLQMGFVYQLPWRSENGGYGGVVGAFVKDWQVNGVFGMFSGSPFTVTANGGVLNTPANQQTADQVGEVSHVGQVGASGLYYDPAAWRQPDGVRFGTSGRNAFTGPGGVNLDMSLFRSFNLGATRRIEVRLEASNITNTPKFGQPNGDVTSGNFMRITGTLNGYPERQIRLGARFSF